MPKSEDLKCRHVRIELGQDCRTVMKITDWMFFTTEDDLCAFADGVVHDGYDAIKLLGVDQRTLKVCVDSTELSDLWPML